MRTGARRWLRSGFRFWADQVSMLVAEMELGSGDCGATRWQSRCLPTLLSLSFRFFFPFCWFEPWVMLGL